MVNKLALSFIYLVFGLAVETESQNTVFSSRNMTWIGGSNVFSSGGSYGTRGVESQSNSPPARHTASMLYHAQTDSIIMGFGVSTSNSRFGDLWRLNPYNNLWTWFAGSNVANVNANYGTKGVAASTNVPGARDGCGMVVDDNGFIYVIGGNGRDTSTNGNLNDMWRFDPDTNWFTWISGSNFVNGPGVYGTRGVEAANNVPGGRINLAAVYHSRTNSIYVYGGYLFDSVSFGGLNDLWRYNITSGMWAWLNGGSAVDQNAVFNTINVESSTTNPGSAYEHGLAINPSQDMIYQFGSFRRITGIDAFSNAMFRYNLTSGRWAWISGSSGLPVISYGMMGVENSTNSPPSQLRPTMAYHAPSNNIIIHGSSIGAWWRFNITSNMWAMIHGSSTYNVLPTWGTLGVSASTNTPGSRYGVAAVIHPKTNNFYCFGGQTISSFLSMGDLWQYVIDPSFVVTTSTTSTTSTSTSTTTSTGTTTTTTSTANTVTPAIIVRLASLDIPSTSLDPSIISSSTTVEINDQSNPTETIVPESTDSPNAADLAQSSQLLMYAGAVGGCVLVLVVAVLAVVIVRRRFASSKSTLKNINQPGQDHQTLAQSGLYTGMRLTQMGTTMHPTGTTMPQYSTITSSYSQPMSIYGGDYSAHFSKATLINHNNSTATNNQNPTVSTMNSMQQMTAVGMNQQEYGGYGMSPGPTSPMSPSTYTGQGSGPLLTNVGSPQMNYQQYQY